MKQFIVTIFVCLTFSTLVNAAERKIAYDRNGNIFVANADGTHPKKIADGDWPEISADGTRVAFNTKGDAKNRPGPERHIAIADVASGKTTVVPNIPSDNCFGPVWSPDGKQLAFSIMTDSVWHLGVINADGSGFRLVKNTELKPDAFGAPEWARDGRSIFCHDLDHIYRIDLDGNLLKKWELSKILTGASMNSGDRLSISPDGTALLMDVDCGSERERKNWDGPQPAIEKLDLSGDKAVRISRQRRLRLGTVLANRERISLHHAKGERERGVDLSNVAGREKSEAAREKRANADRERAVAQNYSHRFAAGRIRPVCGPVAGCRSTSNKTTTHTAVATLLFFLTQQLPRFR